jgi:glycosyltransferase involved in cell wall biosynthesis
MSVMLAAAAHTDALKREAARLIARDASLYLDISPLLDPQWTGIPVVAAGLGSALAAVLPPGRLNFFLDHRLIAFEAVTDSLRRQNGLFLNREIAAGRADSGRLPVLARGAGGKRVGIFPSVKRIRRAFDIECSIFHDLSTLVLPYFHMKLNVDHHMEALLADIASNDLVVTVSAASRDDLVAYLGVEPGKTVVAANGVVWPQGFAVDAANLLAPEGAEPYLLILGTREPRKNVILVFDMLARAPALLESHRFVFAGKMGWLAEQHALPESLKPAVAAGRIVFPGFVGDRVKYRLLAGAEATLYPSLFEGFGLPVLESLSAGTPCVASWSSSIPEVGGALCSYFDPLSATGMQRALRDMLARRRDEGETLRAACRDHAARFTWQDTAATILARLVDLLP